MSMKKIMETLFSISMPGYVDISEELEMGNSLSELVVEFDYILDEALIEKAIIGGNGDILVFVDYGFTSMASVDIDFAKLSSASLDKVLLYRVIGMDLFDSSWEVHSCEVAVPSDISSRSHLLYASFRDKEAAENGWEYSNGLYVLREQDKVAPGTHTSA